MEHEATHPNPRQTQTYLREMFEQHGMRPKNKLGQNFLIDLNLLEVLLGWAQLSRADLALEVGSGTGNLTARLAEQAGAVVSVEIDPTFHALARENVGEVSHVSLLHADILKNKNLLNPAVLQKLQEVRDQYRCQHLKLVANLPYAVATPVISNFLMSDVDVERMVVTVQWEIAERLQARPGTREFGALAVLVQSLAEVGPVRKLPPSVFWPRPKVFSAIVCIRPSKIKRAQVGDVQKFRNFLRDLYCHRRKNLRGGLIGLPSGRHSKEEIDLLLEKLGLDGTIRAEMLDLEQHRRLCEVFG